MQNVILFQKASLKRAFSGLGCIMGKKKRTEKIIDSEFDDMMDDTFSFIVGYTAGGAPYGVTWEEIGIDPDLPFEEKVRLYEEQISNGLKEIV